jgi:GntR family transcriptional regulator/MocR family aminotransferase
MKKQFSGALLTLLGDRSNSDSTIVSELQRHIRELISSGVIGDDERLPSTRSLARDLGISRDTVEAAYQQLDTEGYLVRKTGSGTFVAKQDRIVSSTPRIVQSPNTREAHQTIISLASRGEDILRAGGIVDQTDVHPFVAAMPDIETFPIEVWRQLTSRVIREHGHKLLMYGDAQGYEPLRIEIWKYLATRRGVRCDPDQVLVLTSSQQALSLIGTTLVDPGDIMAIENPGYHGAKLALLAAGSFLKPVSVDVEGIIVSDINDSRAPVRAVYVTPSHQYPTGVTLSIERRMELLDWAHQTGSLIIEDDYDSEFRYDSQPLASIQGLDDGEQVVYMGTFNKVLFPSLRLAYMVLPKRLVKSFITARTLLDGQAPLLTQAVLHSFILEGHFTAHIRRMRQLYHARRDLFMTAIRQHLNAYIDAETPPGGLSVACYLRDGFEEDRSVAIAKSVGIELPTLRRLYLGEPARNGWLLGFAALPPQVAESAMVKLSKAMADFYK